MLTVIILQLSSFLGISAETFYDWNTSVSAGVQYTTSRHLTHRIGYFYQQATIVGDNKYTRQGLITEFCVGNVDNFLIAYVGGRLYNSNEHYLGFTPHLSAAIRPKPWWEIPWTASTYNNQVVMSIGLRFMPGRKRPYPLPDWRR